MNRMRSWLAGTVAVVSIALGGCAAATSVGVGGLGADGPGVHCGPAEDQSLVTSPVEEMNLRIVSYNILVDFSGESWKRRGPTVAGILQELQADLIGIQEASELQLAHLQRELPDYDCFVGDRSDGHRDDQGWYEFVPIFYHRERFELLDKSSHWLSENPSQPGSTFADSKFHGRCLAWVRLKDRRSGRVLMMLNTHTHGKQADRAVRLVQATIAKIAGASPVILTGDFNFTPDSKPYELMLQPLEQSGDGTGQSMVDAHALAAAREGPAATHSSGRRIDYIFLGGSPKVHTYQVLETKTEAGGDPSDHRAVLSTVSWR